MTRSSPSGRGIALFEALQNERNHRLKLVIVAAEKAADMRSVNNRWVRQPERGSSPSKPSREN
jgi:hypothetical protein